MRRDWHSRDLLKIGIALQACSNIALVVSVLWFGQPPLALLVPLVMVSVGTQGLIAANTQALFMSNFKPEIAGSANATLSAGQSLISSLVGFAVTFLHNGTVLVMVGTMLASTVIGTALLLLFSRGQVQAKAA